MKPTILWFETDLRLADHPALSLAVALDGPIIPVFVWDGGDGYAVGQASRCWLHHSLTQFRTELQKVGLDLTIRVGSAVNVIPGLASETGAGQVVWSRRFDPDRVARDRLVAARLGEQGVAASPCPGELLHDPEDIRTGSGGPYRVFTPFFRRFRERVRDPEPMPVPRIGPGRACSIPLKSTSIDSLGLLQDLSAGGTWATTWKPGESGAFDRLETFLAAAVTRYATDRDYPATTGTSRLSPHLHFGEISPRTVWHALLGATGPSTGEAFFRQLVWREFASHLVHHYPHTPLKPLRDEWADFEWREDPESLKRWQEGRTGFPIVDAGMRELMATGWMHNRVRMIVASFLVKDLLVHWRSGAAWFEERLVDADVANNTLGWQWTAGSGADAQPFFRVFNPTSQGRKFDADGRYVRHWIPELTAVPDRYLHAPSLAPADVLAASGVRIGTDYPAPMVDHAEARARALQAYARLSKKR